MAFGLLPHQCFFEAFYFIVNYEGDGRGAQWSLIGKSSMSVPNLTLGWIMVMLLVDIVLYQTLAAYFEAILPTEYGVRKPPYYPILALISLVTPRKNAVANAPAEDLDNLAAVRGQRTILLTTHFMEEADALGERIGIMAAGQLQCCGSPSFLKSFYGTGYTLKMALLPGADKHAILSLVQKHISDATLKPINMPNEMFISLPMDATGSSALSSLFTALSAKKKEMHIESLGLSVASMDEIFVKVGELSGMAEETHHHHHHDHKNSTESKPEDHDSAKNVSEVPGHGHAEGGEMEGRAAPLRKIHGSIPVQALALIIKRFICTKRKIWVLLFQILIPIILTWVAVTEVNKSLDPGSVPPPLTMALEGYENSRTLYADHTGQIPNAHKAIKESEAKNVPDVKSALEKAAEDIIFFREKMIVAGEIVSDGEYSAWYNEIPLHAAPLALNLASNIRCQEIGGNPPFSIQVTNHPLQTLGALQMQMAIQLARAEVGLYGGFVGLMVLTLLLLAPFFVVLPTEERLNKSRSLQFMTGLHPLTYWTMYFLWDAVILLIVASFMILITFLWQDRGFFSSHGGLGAMLVVILGFGYAIILLAYLTSSIPKSVAGGVIILIMFLVIPLIVTLILSFIPPTVSIGLFLHKIVAAAGARFSFFHIVETLQRNAKCNFLGKSELAIICESSTSNEDLMNLQSCCENCTRLGIRCFQPDSFFRWTQGERPTMTGTAEIPGIGQLLFGMMLTSIIFLALHITFELGLVRFIRSQMTKKGTNVSDFLEAVDDEDVRVEEHRVADMIATGNTSMDALVVDNLCKNFGGFSAVSRLTFAVHHGECFGLLGTNGAGKTTTFRMLTGDEIPSLGDVHQDRFTLKGNRRTFISQIGYCPQFDAIIPYFTGKENLQLFGRLRGVPWGRVNLEATRLLESVGLTSSQHVQCRRYSGGMKRRLSAAVALIGSPALVLLDEPTSGVDPMSRRQFWKVLESVKGSGQSIILTSHSMDECEALCSRLGIMVNGQLQCIGGVQHLKHKFAQGYSLIIRLKPATDPENVGRLLETLNGEICRKFHSCMLKDQHETVLQYQIENANLDWSMIYQNLEHWKKAYGDLVEDYSLSETSLEEVFLAFSRKQYPPRDNKIPMCKRILTCQY